MSPFHGGVHREVIRGKNHVEVLLRDGGGEDFSVSAVGADARETNLSLLFSDILRFHEFIGDLVRLGFGVKIPDVQVIGAEFFQAGVDILRAPAP